MGDKKLEQDGREGEERLRKWFDANCFSYLYIGQDRNNFSSLFKGNIKRPDFLVLVDSIGLIAVDAKNHTAFNHKGFTLEYEKEVRRTIAFERLFRIPVWYAFFDKEGGSKSWYWISALKALEVGEMKENHKTQKGTKFLAIDFKHFTKIASNDDFGKLYTQRVCDLAKIKNLT